MPIHKELNARTILKTPDRQNFSCITSGSDVSGTSLSSAKRHYRSLRYNPSVIEAEGIMGFNNIEFSREKASNHSHPHHDALVISTLISNYLVKRTLIDNRSSTNVIFSSALRNIQIPNNEIVRKVMTLVGFSGEPKQTLEEIFLVVHAKGLNMMMKFQVIDASSTYNVILGRS